MAENEKQLSPEEKLLKVIQNGGPDKKEPSPEEKVLSAVQAPPPKVVPVPKPVTAPEKISVPVSPAVSDSDSKSKLKLAKAEPVAAPTAASKDEAKVPAKPLIGGAGPVTAGPEFKPFPLPPPPKSGNRRLGMRTVNRGLAAAALLLLLLTVLEVWAAVQNRPKDRPGQAAVTVPEPEAIAVPVAEAQVDNSALAGILEAFRTKPIFNYQGSEPQGQKPQPGVAPEPPVVSEITSRLKLMGVSRLSEKDTEAIVSDTKDNRLFFVKPGDKIVVGEQQLELIQVRDDQAVFSNGQENLMIK